MSSKLVTNRQAESVRQMANDKKVGRVGFQRVLDDGTFARFLDSLKVDPTTITPPEGARIHIVRVKVRLDRPWMEAVKAAGPNTPDNYNVRKVADLYPSSGTGEVEEDLVMLNYPQGDGSWDKALMWAQVANLKNTVPREAFAIGEQHPSLHSTLGVNLMYAVATTECTFGGDRQACCVWWGGSERGAYLGWISLFGSSLDWFVFRK